MNDPLKQSSFAAAHASTAARHKISFFRQSGWMVIATVTGGVFMSAVHVLANKMEPAEYGVFFTLLRCLILLGIPAAGLQTIFAQQAAATLTEEQSRRLAGATRSVVTGIFGLWLVLALLVLLFEKTLLSLLKIHNPAALWMTLAVALTTLWAPVLKGLLQGWQNFLGFGWVSILDGVARFLAVAAIVLYLGGQAAGAMTGAWLGQIVSILAGLAWTWRIFRGPGAAFAWGPWLGQVLPLTLGIGATMVLQSADVIFVQSIYPESIAPVLYMPAAMIGFALVQFTVPLASVMFPKIVHSLARSEKTDALRLTLLSTALLGGLAAIVCTIWPVLPLRILYFRNSAYWQAAPLVPWFVWGMLPLTLANVLIWNLLARARYAIVPWLMVVMAAYCTAMSYCQNSLLSVVQNLGVFSLITLGVAAWFTWKQMEKGSRFKVQG